MAEEGTPPKSILPGLLLTVFVALALSILVVGRLAYRDHQHHHRAVIEQQLGAVAELKVRELVRWREEHLTDAAFFVENPEFSSLVRRCMNRPADAEARRRLLEWLTRIYTSYNYRHIRLVDPQMVTHLSVPASLPPVPAGEFVHYAELLRTGKPQLSDFFRGDGDRQSYLALRIPIFDQLRGNRPLGVLSLRIDPEDFLCPFILSWPTPSESAETLLVRRDGDHVVFLNDLHWRKEPALSLRIPLTRADNPAVQAVLGQTGIMEGIDYRGVPVLADVRSVPDSPWYLVTKMDAVEAYASTQEHLGMILGLTLALLAAAAAALGLVWRQQHVAFYRERARTAEALQKANELFSLFMRYSPIYVFIKEVTATESRVLQVSDNFEQMVGIPAAQMRGKSMAELFPAEFAAQITADDQAVVSSGERLAKDEDLNGRHYVTIKFPITQGDKTLLAGYTIDITERKQAEETIRRLVGDLRQQTTELQGANRELEAFSYTLSHDLRSHLARISMASEALQEFEGEQLGQEGRYCLQTLLDSCQSMDDLIATMLTLARVTRQEMLHEDLDLSALAERLGAELALAEPDRAIRITVEPGLRVNGDAHLLEVALRNLLGNACKYTRGKPEARISLTASHQGDRLVFAVADNGAGFDMGEVSRIFQPFQRLSSARAFPGFGIGLTTVQRIIQRHGGEIWAEGVPGEGATFFFTLPPPCG